ncbi:DUF4268 domain-containing protein [Marinilactibacillus sp. GCM10026970]|uniref:DUF4268 domain-containing protein n=1 Tax=Marinilactibacillus sp. GCM10026970 TaxID=3252642 RepID=UPI003615F99C
MFLIDREKNEAIPLNKMSFQELKFKERAHLQEWICKNTNLLGERLLVIQKEFSSFDDTRERLDLLALDESGNLVIVENKLDDSGKDVVWQSLKYASYCSGLAKSDIREIFQKYLDSIGNKQLAEDELCEFLEAEDYSEIELNNDDQRIIMVAANFRKEVTSTAMWLLDHNIKVKCIKVTPYEYKNQIFLDTEQIIPIIDAEDYLIKIGQKKQEQLTTKEDKQSRHVIRLEFWNQLLKEMNQKSPLFSNISPSKDNWISCGSGYSGMSYSFVITKKFCHVELYIGRGSKEDNKFLFDQLYSKKDEIEAAFKNSLNWQRLEDKKGCRIAFKLEGVNAFNREDWPKMIRFMSMNMIRFEAVFKDVLQGIVK